METETEIVEVRLPTLPKGYRYTGEYRYAKWDEYYLINDSFLEQWDKECESDYTHHIVEKIEWVPQPGETFYIVDELGTVYSDLAHGKRLIKLIKRGNYFKTEALAEEAAVKMGYLLKECSHDSE